MTTVNLTNEAQLRNYTQIEVKIDPEYGVAWIYQSPSPRPCYNPTLVEELRSLQIMLEVNDGKLPFKGENVKIDYLVLDSKINGIFSMGGDLSLFKDCVQNKDKEGLLKYAKLCIDTIYGFIVGCRQPITTISLIRGDAMGGGFEVALSCNVIIAERQVGMGFPEILFNIFPGMGGYHLLSQRLPQKQVEKMMLNGHKYSAERLFEIGVVDQLEESGKGTEGVYNYIKECNKHRKGVLALKNVVDKVNNISYQELLDVCRYWVDVTMQINDKDLRLMDRLIRSQTKQAFVDINNKENIRSIA